MQPGIKFPTIWSLLNSYLKYQGLRYQVERIRSIKFIFEISRFTISSWKDTEYKNSEFVARCNKFMKHYLVKFIILLIKEIVNVIFNNSSLKKSFQNWQENAGNLSHLDW